MQKEIPIDQKFFKLEFLIKNMFFRTFHLKSHRLSSDDNLETLSFQVLLPDIIQKFEKKIAKKNLKMQIYLSK